MKTLKVETSLQEAIQLQKKIVVLVKKWVEEVYGKSFDEYTRLDLFEMRNGLTMENATPFLEKHAEEWKEIHDTLKSDEFHFENEELFITMMKRVNVHHHIVDEHSFIQFDYSKIIGRWWNVLTENSRGIVYSYPEMEVLSLPFHKFYNLNERKKTEFDSLNHNQPSYLVEKLDGTMIHVFEYKGELFTATRGAIAKSSFTMKAMELLKEKADMGALLTFVKKGYTPVFELLLTQDHEDSLVVVYEEEAIRLIGVRERSSGDYIHPNELSMIAKDLGVDSAIFYEGLTLMDAVSKRTVIQNMEGWVVYLEDGAILKVKGEEYMKLKKPADLEEKLKGKPKLMAKSVFNLMETNTLDDVLAMIRDPKTKEDMEAMQDKILGVLEGLHQSARKLYETHYDGDRGQYARTVIATEPSKLIQTLALSIVSEKVFPIEWKHVENYID